MTTEQVVTCDFFGALMYGVGYFRGRLEGEAAATNRKAGK